MTPGSSVRGQALRIFVLSGWFGRGLSPGMAALAKQLEPYGETTFHPWDDPNVVMGMDTISDSIKVAIIGYSLGANQLGWIDHHTSRKIDLGVAYDPSKQSPLVTRMLVGFKQVEFIQRAPHFKRILCYYHPNAWFYGGSRYIGTNVETTTINMPHLAVQFSQELHAKTIEAVQAL